MGHLQIWVIAELKSEGLAWDILKICPFGVSNLAVWHETSCNSDALAFKASPYHFSRFGPPGQIVLIFS